MFLGSSQESGGEYNITEENALEYQILISWKNPSPITFNEPTIKSLFSSSFNDGCHGNRCKRTH